MRTFASFVLVTALVNLFFGLPVLAQKEQTFAVWWAEPRARYSDYPVMYTFNGCTVRPHVSGYGVRVNATDPSWYGKIVLQSFTIRKNNYGGAYKEESISLTEYGDHFFWYFDGGYDVFFVKCREAAKSLPLGVRKAFLGYYTLE